MKVKKDHGQKKGLHLLWKVCRIQTHRFCLVVNRKSFDAGHKSRKCFTVPFPLAKINFFDSRLASCVLDLYLLIKFGTVI